MKLKIEYTAKITHVIEVNTNIMPTTEDTKCRLAKMLQKAIKADDVVVTEIVCEEGSR